MFAATAWLSGAASADPLRATAPARSSPPAALASSASASATTPPPSLPALGAERTGVTVSGLSSGGYMAVQFATAWSSRVSGVAAVAGGPYDCATTAFGLVDTCLTGWPSGVLAWNAARARAATGSIDPVANIARQRVYLFSGTRDRTVLPRIVAATRDYYRAAGVPAAAIADVRDVPAGHAFLSPLSGNACGTSVAPFVERCLVGGRPYDQPRAILSHLLGPLQPAATRPSATVQPFDQRPYAGRSSGLAPTGWVYVPAACSRDALGGDSDRSGGGGAGSQDAEAGPADVPGGTTAGAATTVSSPCRVHVVFHGCRQGAGVVGDAITARLGFNRWADTNRVIVLYPQIAPSEDAPYNPRGCWDWWGSYGWRLYTGPAFPQKNGVQPAAIAAMLDRLSSR